MTARRDRMEILAPGGSLEAIETACHNGADAVYVGVGSLNARVRARNLTPAQLPGVVAYARSFGTAVYVALNVPLLPETVRQAAEILAFSHVHGAAAVILRDPRLMSASREILPDLPVHASTQYGVASIASARAAVDLGCSRAILARELSREAIGKIVSAVPELQTEVFVFGALCFGVSGRCLLGEAVGGRSGNHGACSQACRLPWFDGDGRPLGHVFSMRDLDLFPRLPDLSRLGVSALKIEGRLKSPAWVGCVTRWLRRAVDGRDPPGLTPDEADAFDREIRTLFSRDRTSAFFDGVTDRAALIVPDLPGHRGLDVPVFSVTRDRRVRFRAPVALNVRDGLLLRLATENGETFIPWAIPELRDELGRNCLRVSAGRWVEIPLPPVGGIRGVAIHSADAVRARYETVDRPMPGSVAEGRVPWPRFVSIEVGADHLSAVLERGRMRCKYTLPLATQPARNEGYSPALATRLFGDAKARIDPGLYINPSTLKEARRTLVERFDAAVSARVDDLAAAIEARILADAGRFPDPDRVLLDRGPAAVSRVTGFSAREVFTASGSRFAVVPHARGTTVYFRGK